MSSNDKTPAAPAVAPEGCTPADAKMLLEANHGLAAENDRLRRRLRPFAQIASSPLSWAMVEYCIDGDPERQTLQAPQMQRAFNRAADSLRENVPSHEPAGREFRRLMSGTRLSTPLSPPRRSKRHEHRKHRRTCAIDRAHLREGSQQAPRGGSFGARVVVDEGDRRILAEAGAGRARARRDRSRLPRSNPTSQFRRRKVAPQMAGDRSDSMGRIASGRQVRAPAAQGLGEASGDVCRRLVVVSHQLSNIRMARHAREVEHRQFLCEARDGFVPCVVECQFDDTCFVARFPE